MSTFTVFHTYSVNDNVTAANLNGNISALVTAGNSIDRTNLAGGTGIDASSMNPSTSAAATFGGAQAYTFSNGLVSTGAVTLNGPTTLTGTTTFGSEIDFTGTTVTAGQVAIGGDNGAVKGMLVNVPTGSTNGIQLQVNGVTKVQMSNAGVLTTQAAAAFGGALQLSPTINATTVASWATPLYTSAAGATAAATAHEEFGVTGAIAGNGGTAVITLTNNAVFTSSSSYVVIVTQNDGVTTNVPNVLVTYTSGSSFTITTANGTAATHTFAWYAVGT